MAESVARNQEAARDSTNTFQVTHNQPVVLSFVIAEVGNPGNRADFVGRAKNLVLEAAPRAVQMDA